MENYQQHSFDGTDFVETETNTVEVIKGTDDRMIPTDEQIEATRK